MSLEIKAVGGVRCGDYPSYVSREVVTAARVVSHRELPSTASYDYAVDLEGGCSALLEGDDYGRMIEDAEDASLDLTDEHYLVLGEHGHWLEAAESFEARFQEGDGG
jgi:hypothetical protein